MRPCNCANAELHHRPEQRAKYDYVNHDLTHLNIWHEFDSRPLEEVHQAACVFYEEQTGQKPQLNSVYRYDRKSGKKKEIIGFAPVREIVVNTNDKVSEEDMVRLCEKLKEKYGITPLKFSMDMDEGHNEYWVDENTWKVESEWIPNYHAHVYVDIMEYRPDVVQDTKEEVEQEEGKSKKKPKLKYGRTIKFTEKQLSEMQDYCAECLGMERGEKGAKREIEYDNIQEFKQKKAAENLAALGKMISQYTKDISDLKTEFATLNALIEAKKTENEELSRSGLFFKLFNTAERIEKGVESARQSFADSLTELNNQNQSTILKINSDKFKDLQKAKNELEDERKKVKQLNKEIKRLTFQLQEVSDPDRENKIAELQEANANLEKKKDDLQSTIKKNKEKYNSTLAEKEMEHQREMELYRKVVSDGIDLGLTSSNIQELWDKKSLQKDCLTFPDAGMIFHSDDGKPWTLRVANGIEILKNRIWTTTKDWIESARRKLQQWQRKQESPTRGKGRGI